MHKKKPGSNRQSFADFSDKLSAKWRTLTKPIRPTSDEAAVGTSDLESIFRHLIGIPTVTGNYQANHDALDYIDNFLRVRGMYVERHVWNNVESLVATTRKTKTPEVLLAAHLDVVPADQSLFEVREEGDRLFGRGTLDMKFAIASYLSVIDEIQGDIAAYDLGIAITTDEEAGGTDGMAKLIEKGYLPSVCILPDGGDNWQIQLHAKGFLYASMVAMGKPAHGSRPWLGHNAILTLAHALLEVEALFEGHNADTKTLNVGIINGGKAVNQVADHAEVLLDIRLMSEKEKAQVLTDLERICEKYAVELSVVIDGAVAKFELSNPYIRAFADITADVTGEIITGSSTLGSNDTRYLAQHNIPCVSLYPPGAGHHGPSEWVSKKGLHDFREIILRYIKQIASQP